MKILNIWTLLFSFSILMASCGDKAQPAANNGGNATTTENNGGTATADKTPVRKEVTKMPSAEASAKFGMRLDPDCLFSGFYHAYTDETGKEVLQGQMEIKTAESREEYTARKKSEIKGAMSEEDEMNLLYNYVTVSYTGQYVDGVKDGRFTMDASYYESGGLASITFDAKNNTCTNATYDGGGEGMCFGYDGPLQECEFDQIAENTKEMECE